VAAILSRAGSTHRINQAKEIEMSNLEGFVTQSMSVMFPAAEVAYRQERIRQDFHRASVGRRRRRGLRRDPVDASSDVG